MKSKDLRKAARKPLHYPAWIDLADGSPPRECSLADISEPGAKLKRPSDFESPATFCLLLTHDGRTSRQCQIVRREGIIVGIRYLHGAPRVN